MRKRGKYHYYRKNRGGVEVCIKKDGKTYYAPTFKDDDQRIKGLNPAPLKVSYGGNGYRLYTISEITGLLQNLEMYKWYINTSGRDIRLMFTVNYHYVDKETDEDDSVFVYHTFKKDTILRFNIVKPSNNEVTHSGQIEYLDSNNIVTIYSLLPYDSQEGYRYLTYPNPISQISSASFA